MTNKENKSVQKCVRMTPSTYDFVDKQDGAGFNDKLERMIHKYEKREAELQLRLDTLNDMIRIAQEHLTQIKVLRQHTDRILSYVDYVENIISEDMPKLL